MAFSTAERLAVPAARIDLSSEDRAWIVDRIDEVLASGQLTLGPWGEQLERRFAARCRREHGVATSSGTSALEILMRTLGVEDKDVLLPTNTFVATAAAVVHAGGRPVLCDVEPCWLGLSPDDAERRLTPDTVGIVAVHVGGLVSPAVEGLRDLARRNGLWLVEDAAHAHAASLDGVPAGSFGLAAAFSFYPTKVMTSGEGGMLVTDDAALAAEARILRDQGKASFTRNEHVRLGSNWRLSELHAIVGIRQLERLDELVAARRSVAERYRELLADAPIDLLAPAPGAIENGYKVIAVPRSPVDRAALKAGLRERHGVSLAGEVYELPLHRQPALASYARGGYPVADDHCARHLCLPVYPSLTNDELEHVASSLVAELDGP
jgi:dTDP-4-amino-4,6-dideoxygalactose transaminase